MRMFKIDRDPYDTGRKIFNLCQIVSSHHGGLRTKNK